MTKPTETETTTVQYEVLYGESDIKKRKKTVVPTEQSAQALFKEKEQKGCYVDVVKVTTVTHVTREQLTSPVRPQTSPKSKR